MREHVELAYATTVHGAQGETAHTGHLLLGEHTSAAAAYVAMTRGREDNVAHLVAENLDDARNTGSRPSVAIVPTSGPLTPPDVQPRTSNGTHPPPLEAALADLRVAWSTERALRGALARCREPPALHGRTRRSSRDLGRRAERPDRRSS